MITCTEKALAKFKTELSKRGKGLGIKIGIKTTGCSGLAYVLEYVDIANDYDKQIYIDGLTLFIDPKHFVYLNGLQVDFIKQGLNEGFNFVNPNEKNRCGCGESFNV